MTPQEKAQELFNTMGKKFALIAVYEVLKVFKGLHKPEYCGFDAIGERQYTYKGEHEDQMTGYDMADYYNEVKTEINNLWEQRNKQKN